MGRESGIDKRKMDMCAKKITVRFIRPPNKIDVWEHELIFDLFIDLWVFPDGKYVVLDEDGLGNAIKEGWISAYQAKKARETIDQLIVMIEKGESPPEIVKEDIKIISQ